MKDFSGRRFDHYYIVKRIEENIEGDRYTAYDTNPPERAVSLLLVSELFARRSGFRHRFQQAMERAQQLNDPSLIGILNHGSWTEGDTCYVVTEDPKGYTLREIIERLHDDERDLKLTDKLEIVREVCTAIELVRLNYLPARDLSPDNILDNILITLATSSSRQQLDRPIQSALRVVVTDLGFGRISDGHFSDYTQGEIFALGTLLYRLVVGESQLTDLLRGSQVTPPRILNPALPRSVERIILTALSPDPRERYDDPRLMAIDLTNAYWDAYHYDIEAPHRERAVDLAHWLLLTGTALDGIEYVDLQDGRQLPAISGSTVTGVGARHKDVRLEALQYSVEAPPGGRAEIVLRLENVSEHTRHCWIRIDSKPEHIVIDTIPTSVRLGDHNSVDNEKESRVVFQPSAMPLCPAGLYQIKIAVFYSQNNAWIDSDVIEVALVVTRIQNCAIDVWPRTLDVRQPGQLVVTNRGNAAESLLLSWAEPKGNLYFDIEGIATDRASIILDSGDSGQIAFRPRLRRPKWFGKEEHCPFKIEIITPDQTLLESTECQAVIRSWIPMWLLLLFALASLLLVFVGLWLFRPQVEYVRNCDTTFIVTQPSLALCVWPYNSVGTLTILPGDIPFDLERREVLLPAPLPDENENTIHLVGQNNISRILPFLAYRKDIRLPVRRPVAPTPLLPQLVQFCVGDANRSDFMPVCSTVDEQATLSLTRGQVQTLLFTWQTENVTGEQIELLPQTVPFALATNNAIAPAPSTSMTYTLNLVDPMGMRLEPLKVSVTIKEIKDVVVEPLLYLRKSPGQVYESIALLKQGTEVILLTQPLDYQQNEDDLLWVQILVADTQESGWVAWEGLSRGTNSVLAGTGITAGRDFTNLGNLASNENSTINESVNSSIEFTNIPTGNRNGAPTGLASLPAVLPEFGPTVTSTPTPTATPTPTLLPTSTPVPTQVPLVVSVEIKPMEISNCEEIEARWNIEGAKEVYFDYGRGPFDLMTDNRLRIEKLRHGVDFGFWDKPETEGEAAAKFIIFRWKIVLEDGTERILAEHLRVEKKPLNGEKDPCRFVPNSGN